MLENPSDLVARAKATITECSVTEARECLSSDTIFIDVREPAEFQRGSVPGAINIPRGLLEFDIYAVVDRARANQSIPHGEQAIILYCGTGGRSALAAKCAEELGYKNVKSMAGGLVAWAQAQMPLEIAD